MNSLIILVIAIVHILTFLEPVGGYTTELGCAFPKFKDSEKDYPKLKPFIGKSYQVTDPSDKYIYTVAVCGSVGGLDGVGAIQTTVKKPKSTVILGKYKNADIISGTDWLYLEYLDGENYKSHCGHEGRRAVIMFTCDESISDLHAEMIILEENNNKTNDCYYLFELSHQDICPARPSSNLSLGSIFIIVLFSLIAVYLFFGFLYQRFALGAKGMEQIPNYSFWVDFGNLQADGCNFVCRSGENRGPRTYKGVGDDQLDDTEERDDHLLPM
ncbi:cation-dependent mannose-6-phosphate receptor-like [Haliotis rubra]|uniref:cation-dependent mannose-6-phosphate receptor-like n=1 Tax=Haliotis rubra TaxID=36100 RepID=UPI001EE5569C|nr:cation-dependent mannose-6-phosphate receptor-like [Haliotis rubra]